MLGEEDYGFMRLAIEEAAKSQWGSGTDPKVGAVIAADGELVGSAHRGQRARGDHAEFTLLQKVLESKDLTEGTTLYTTLEPCTTRSHNKRSCAKWIVEKGVRKVVIGILDPNPVICGRGYWHLVDNGVEVEFFPFDLAKQVLEMNVSFVKQYRDQVRMAPAFARMIGEHKSQTIARYVALGWGEALSLQDCPNLSEGWSLDQVEIRVEESKLFNLPEEYKLPYREFLARCRKEGRFRDDSENFMLIQNPRAFSDQPRHLILEVAPACYSYEQFYREVVALSPAKREALVEDFVQGSLQAGFPHSLCMHMIIVTNDNRLLLTERSPKVDDHPGTWSVSVEERLSWKDFEDDTNSAALNWASRLLKEELALDETYYHVDNVRLLSVFLETDILNTAICAYVELQIDASELDVMLRDSPRTDYEFVGAPIFLELDKRALLSELLHPRRRYHPTSGYRLLYTLLKRFGSPSDDDLRAIGGGHLARADSSPP